MGIRHRLLSACGVTLNESEICPRCFFGGQNITIGNSYLNWGVFIEANAAVTIGDRCAIGMETMILTSDHERGGHQRRAGVTIGRPVAIGDGCWLGARVMVLPGVTIAPGCVIAAGSIVTADTESDGLYAGTPARRLRDL
jgi:maltose O-acetyltransferase